MAYDGMCFTEGNALLCKMLCNIRCIQKASAQRDRCIMEIDASLKNSRL